MTMRHCIIGLCMLACLWVARPLHAQIELFKLATVDDVPTRFDLGYDGGSGMGFTRGFTQVDSFLPLCQMGDAIIFNDLHGNFFDQGGMQQLSLGFGARTCLPMIDCLVGLNAYYDNYNDGDFTYHQLGIGAELVGDYFDLRGNVYLPLGGNRKTVGFADTTTFQGFDIITSRAQFLEVSQRGVDIEAGVTFPPSELAVARAAIGYYNYQGQGATQIQGVRGRLEACILDTVTLEGVVENDNVFGTTAYAGVGIRLGGQCRRECSDCALLDHRADPVYRNPNAIIRPVTETGAAPFIVRQAAGGAPFRVIHVDSLAAPGGNGTFERPFQTLAQAQAGSIPGDLLYVHAGSVLAAAGFGLQNNQSFLGEGTPHTLQTTLGPVALPRATNFTLAPILNIPDGANGVTLAQNNLVSGFQFLGGTDTKGILGSGSVGFFNINNNSFNNFRSSFGFPNNPTGAGIFLSNPSGAGLITNNRFSNSDFGVAILQGVNGRSVAVGVRDNTFTSNSSDLFAFASTGTIGLQYLRNAQVGTGTTFLIGLAPAVVQLEPPLGNSTPIIQLGNVVPITAGSLQLP